MCEARDCRILKLRVKLLLFAMARERAGRAAVELELGERATLAALKEELRRAVPALEPLIPVMRFAIDSEYADDDQTIPPGAEVAAIPPVSGGSFVREGQDPQ